MSRLDLQVRPSHGSQLSFVRFRQSGTDEGHSLVTTSLFTFQISMRQSLIAQSRLLPAISKVKEYIPKILAVKRASSFFYKNSHASATDACGLHNIDTK